MNSKHNSNKMITTSSLNQMSPFVSLHNELNKVFSNFNNLFQKFDFSRDDFESVPLFPAMDIVNDKEHIKIEIEMPGMGEDDIKVTINNGILNVKGEKTTSKQDKDKSYVSREIKYGMYERNIPLPEGIDAEKATASFKKGMLWVNIPKNPAFIKEGKEIPIQKVK